MSKLFLRTRSIEKLKKLDNLYKLHSVEIYSNGLSYNNNSYYLLLLLMYAGYNKLQFKRLPNQRHFMTTIL